MSTFTTNGCNLYIGKALNDYPDITPDIDIYSGQDWHKIEHLINLGRIGEEVETVQNLVVDSNDPDGIQKYVIQKVAYTPGEIEIVTALDMNCAGQLTLIKGVKELSYYPFRLVLNDAPACGKPSERLFVAQIIRVSEQYDEANDVAKLVVGLSRATDIKRIAVTQ